MLKTKTYHTFQNFICEIVWRPCIIVYPTNNFALLCVSTINPNLTTQKIVVITDVGFREHSGSSSARKATGTSEFECKKVSVCKEYSVLSGEQEKSLQVDLYEEVMRARKEMGIALQELGNVEPRSSVLILFFSVLVHFFTCLFKFE